MRDRCWSLKPAARLGYDRPASPAPLLPMSPTDELVAVAVADNQPEAEMLCSRLRSVGIACMPRLTNRGAGAGQGYGIGGPHEIMVRSKDAQAARKILRPG